MKNAHPDPDRLPAGSDPSWNSTRRAIDATALAIFHLATFLVLGWASPKMAAGALMLAVPVLGLDVMFFLSRPERKPILDGEPDPAQPEKKESPLACTFEFLVLYAPPVLLIAWFLTIIWQRRTLTQNELIGVVAGMPVVVGLASWIIYLRMTRRHVGVRNAATQFIAISMLSTWVLGTFLFVVLLICLLSKLNVF